MTDINLPGTGASELQPWHTCPASRLARLRGICTDVDDTLTRDGAIEPAALQALQALHAAGLPVMAVTGRPMGWSRPFAQSWPLLAIVAENGAVALKRDPAATDGLRVEYLQDAATRARNTERLQAMARSILGQLPHARLARDSAGRITDIAVDHAEHTHLSAADVERVVGLMRTAGMTATVSSIHINGWYGTHDKWVGACWALQLLQGQRLEDEVGEWLFVGDSPNDQAMFARFPLSVGVANLRHVASQLHSRPAYLTAAERGQGFAEVARAVLAARAGPQGQSRP